MTGKKQVSIFKSAYIVMMYTIVWEKFTIGYFRVKIVHGKIFTSLGVFEEKF